MDCPEVTQQVDVARDCNLGSTSRGTGVYMGSLRGAGKGSTEGMLSSLLQPWAWGWSCPWGHACQRHSAGRGRSPPYSCSLGPQRLPGVPGGHRLVLSKYNPYDSPQALSHWRGVLALHQGPGPIDPVQHRDGRTGVTGVTGSCDIHSAQRQNRRGHGDYWGGPWGTHKWGLASPLPHPQPGGESAQVPSTLGTLNNLQGSPRGPHPR